ncbi:Type I phosphodiesterase / nucleotide pyrophosphatase [Acetitomaculum ruminis DSM 5522]|uniref:Type I phosphodiesterase / nucleotide pyrophosphatase n=1 Tax=Acetitomaculum ruminis DSM 5522 TaxID=1120918 RepID=A0A1I0UYM1_9FIRM|nr:alkaline phosphatase family protein [Acetitomaculum ruminis]SFA69102.1 Type I phosphodiesterase / nucleotide pyrophosphatase [Acetitomaculum ruminis DSM 5522]
MEKIKSICAFYNLTKNSLKNKRTLVLYLDGLGYYLYKYAYKKNALNFTSAHFDIFPQWSLKNAVTNPNMAAMISGKNSEYTGIYSRKDHILNVATIFDEGYDQVILEGDTIILNTTQRPILHVKSKVKTVDFGVFSDTLKAIEEGKYFIFSHFNEIDDYCHTYGPYSEEVLGQIKKTDCYIEKICKNFSGNILLVSDHGVHTQLNEKNEQFGIHGNVFVEEYESFEEIDPDLPDKIQSTKNAEDKKMYLEDHLSLYGYLKNENRN